MESAQKCQLRDKREFQNSKTAPKTQLKDKKNKKKRKDGKTQKYSNYTYQFGDDIDETLLGFDMQTDNLFGNKDSQTKYPSDQDHVTQGYDPRIGYDESLTPISLEDAAKFSIDPGYGSTPKESLPYKSERRRIHAQKDMEWIPKKTSILSKPANPKKEVLSKEERTQKLFEQLEKGEITAEQLQVKIEVMWEEGEGEGEGEGGGGGGGAEEVSEKATIDDNEAAEPDIKFMARQQKKDSGSDDDSGDPLVNKRVRVGTVVSPERADSPNFGGRKLRKAEPELNKRSNLNDSFEESSNILQRSSNFDAANLEEVDVYSFEHLIGFSPFQKIFRVSENEI